MRNAIHVVVLLFIAIMTAALLGTALVKVRGAAIRMQCMGNLKQLGLALHDYHDTHNQFPRAGMPNPQLPQEKQLSWIVSIIPYVEADNLFSRLNREGSWDAEENRFLAVMKYRIVTCPGQPVQPPVSTMTASHYVAITGLGSDAVHYPLNDPRAGFMGFDRTLDLAKFQGNTSTLLILMETRQIQGSWTAAGWPTSRGIEEGVPMQFGPTQPFGGLHFEGANVLFADGSVRLFRGSLSTDEITAMATMRGSQDAKPVGEE